MPWVIWHGYEIVNALRGDRYIYEFERLLDEVMRGDGPESVRSYLPSL